MRRRPGGGPLTGALAEDGPDRRDGDPTGSRGAGRKDERTGGAVAPPTGAAAGTGAAAPAADPLREAWAEPMRLALREAAAAPGTGDVPVGAVVLGPDGSVVGRGRNEREAVGDPTAHAEVVAIRQAAAALGGWRLTGCTLVVTLEPCVMCAGAIVLSRLERVVYGAVDEKAGAAGSLWDLLRDRRLNHRPEVIGDVLAGECAALLTAFFREGGRHTDFGARPGVR